MLQEKHFEVVSISVLLLRWISVVKFHLKIFIHLSLTSPSTALSISSLSESIKTNTIYWVVLSYIVYVCPELMVNFVWIADLHICHDMHEGHN